MCYFKHITKFPTYVSSKCVTLSNFKCSVEKHLLKRTTSNVLSLGAPHRDILLTSDEGINYSTLTGTAVTIVSAKLSTQLLVMKFLLASATLLATFAVLILADSNQWGRRVSGDRLLNRTTVVNNSLPVPIKTAVVQYLPPVRSTH